jgi:hypothetical protein
LCEDRRDTPDKTAMINHWWRSDFGRAPNLEDLTDTQRVVVLAQVLPVRTHWNFAINTFLVIWIVGAVAAMLAAQLSDAWGVEGLHVLLILYIVLPTYAIALRKLAIARAMRRAILRTVRDDRLESIRSIIDNH